MSETPSAPEVAPAPTENSTSDGPAGDLSLLTPRQPQIPGLAGVRAPEFGVAFRGYDRDDVDEYVDLATKVLERALRRLEHAESENVELSSTIKMLQAPEAAAVDEDAAAGGDGGGGGDDMIKTTVTVSVPDIHCGSCKRAIEGALRPHPSIEAARVDVDEKVVHVTFHAPLTTVDLTGLIEDQGFAVETITAG